MVVGTTQRKINNCRLLDHYQPASGFASTNCANEAEYLQRTKRMKSIFISHSSEDAELASHVTTYLERRGLKCWITPRNVDPAKDWDQAILDAIQDCSAMLLLFSGSADSSRHVHREIHHADEARKFLLTLRIEDVQPDKLAYFLSLNQWVDWIDRRDEALERIYTALSSLGDGVSVDQEPQKARSSRTISIPDGEKFWLRPSSREFVPSADVQKEKRVLSSNTSSKNAVGYLRMRAVANGGYDWYHKVVRPDGSLHGYFTNGFSEVAYTYGFVSPENDECIFVLHHNFRATKSTLSILRTMGRVWTKMAAPKVAVVKRNTLAFEISTGEITEFNFRDDSQSQLFCMNGEGFFLFDKRKEEFLSNVKFDQTYAHNNSRAVSPKAPLVVTAISEFERKGSLDNREIYQSTIQIYDITTGERMMKFQMPGDEYSKWEVSFSADGKMLKVALNGEEHIYDIFEVG